MTDTVNKIIKSTQQRQRPDDDGRNQIKRTSRARGLKWSYKWGFGQALSSMGSWRGTALPLPPNTC